MAFLKQQKEKKKARRDIDKKTAKAIKSLDDPKGSKKPEEFANLEEDWHKGNKNQVLFEELTKKWTK